MLFEPFKLKNCEMRNRIVMAPMTRNQQEVFRLKKLQDTMKEEQRVRSG